MRTLWILISLIVLFLFHSCTQQLHSQKVVRNGIEMLYGPVTLKQLYYDYPQWQEIQNKYQPDPALIQKLTELEDSFEVKIFLATWCSDSQREVPAFFKILDVAKLDSKISTPMWAVDRKLKLDNALPQEHNIQRVATFIFYRNGNEIGRIVESPEALLLEQDIYHILSGITE